MKNKLFILCLVNFSVILHSCIDEYLPRIDKYDNLLVVDGKITNMPGPYTVRLSRSSLINNSEINPVLNCRVFIFDNTGNSEELTSIEPGIYQTSATGIRGIIGNKYKISIQLPDGQLYESEYEQLKNPVKLDSVYARVEYREDEEFDHSLAGYQFYLDTELSLLDTNYFLWDLEATYQYQSDYTIRWIYEGSLEWFYGPDSLYNCWANDHIDGTYIFNTDGLNPPFISAFPLHFVNTQTRKLSVKYSLLVRQYSISERAFNFYNGIKENSNQGALYSRQPTQVQGNVHNSINKDEPVLGYFLVAGMDEKRIFVERPKYPVPFYYTVCQLSEADYEAYSQLGMMDPAAYPIYAIETNGGRRAVPSQGCVDCRRHGGTITKPEFWID